MVKPWPRAGHTAVGHGPLMLIFGGMNGKQNFNDLSVYSIRSSLLLPFFWLPRPPPTSPHHNFR